MIEKFKNGDAPIAPPRTRPFLINSLRVVFIVSCEITMVESGTHGQNTKTAFEVSAFKPRIHFPIF